MIHSARPHRIARNSFTMSGRKGARNALISSGERKKNLLQTAADAARGTRAQFVEGSNTAHDPGGQKDEAFANALRFGKLVNGKNEAASRSQHLAQYAHHLTPLLGIEAIEWLIHQ